MPKIGVPEAAVFRSPWMAGFSLPAAAPNAPTPGKTIHSADSRDNMSPTTLNGRTCSFKSFRYAVKVPDAVVHDADLHGRTSSTIASTSVKNLSIIGLGPTVTLM